MKKTIATFMAALSFTWVVAVPSASASVNDKVAIQTGKSELPGSMSSKDKLILTLECLSGGIGLGTLAVFSVLRHKDSKASDADLSHGYLLPRFESKLSDTKEARRQVIIDTLEYCYKNQRSLKLKGTKSGGKFSWQSDNSELMDYETEFSGTGNGKVTSHPAQIWLTNGKSLQSMNAVAYLLFKEGNTFDFSHTAVLNFANFFNPGGGVMKGSKAQEEALCRMTTLYPNLNTDEMNRGFYDSNNSITIFSRGAQHWIDLGIARRAIYTRRVKQIKDDTNIGSVGHYVDGPVFNVITAAAPNLKRCPFSLTDVPTDVLLESYKKSARMIFQIAYQKHDRNLVLGAFGCGAFGGDPTTVAQAFYEVLQEQSPGRNAWAHEFENIILPIFDIDVKGKKNYQAFLQQFAKYEIDFGVCQRVLRLESR